MPVATSYTEASLAVFLDAELGPVADVLGWTADGVTVGSYAHPVNRTLAALGVATIGVVTDLRALELVGLREAWRVAVNHLATKYDFSLDQQSFSRSQMLKAAREALQAAEADVASSTSAALVAAASSIPVVTIGRLRDVHDPYTYVPDESRVLP